MLPDIGPEIAVYTRRLGEQAGVWAHLRAKLLNPFQVRVARWKARRQTPNRLRLIVAGLLRDEDGTLADGPNLIESLEARLALTNDLQAREQSLKYLCEPLRTALPVLDSKVGCNLRRKALGEK
jgi:hypothetical protein